MNLPGWVVQYNDYTHTRDNFNTKKIFKWGNGDTSFNKERSNLPPHTQLSYIIKL